MRISDWSSDVCSSDLRLLDRMGDEEEGFALLRDQGQQVLLELAPGLLVDRRERLVHQQHLGVDGEGAGKADALAHAARQLVRVGLLETRSEEHTSELQSLMRISYAVFCLKKKNQSLTQMYMTTAHFTHSA